MPDMTQPNAHLFLHCPRCGKKTLDPDGRKSFACTACAFKFYLNCAAAAIGLIFRRDKKLLVTRRKHPPARGMLDFPGGFAQPGETIEACMEREIKEELSIGISSMTYLFSLPNTYLYAGVRYDITDFVFLCRAEHPEDAVPGDDVADVLFMDINELDTVQFGLESPKTVIERLCSGKFDHIMPAR